LNHKKFIIYTSKFTHAPHSIVAYNFKKLKMAKYNLNPEGNKIIEKIVQSMNNGSYTNNLNNQIIPKIDEINQSILKLILLF
jgi:hypothetical protein